MYSWNSPCIFPLCFAVAFASKTLQKFNPIWPTVFLYETMRRRILADRPHLKKATYKDIAEALGEAGRNMPTILSMVKTVSENISPEVLIEVDKDAAHQFTIKPSSERGAGSAKDVHNGLNFLTRPALRLADVNTRGRQWPCMETWEDQLQVRFPPLLSASAFRFCFSVFY